MSPTAPAVLVIARGSGGTRAQSSLDDWLGPDRSARLHAALLHRAACWAARAAPNEAFVALAPGDAPAGMPAGVECFPQVAGSHGERVDAAARRVFDGTPGPVIIVGTSLPGLAGYHAAAATGDLRAGCEVVLGVAIGGGLYLLGLREPRPELFDLLDGEYDGEATRRHARRITDDLALEVGMLHYERALVTPMDARAVLADPLAPGDVVAALGP
jgi:glycosyltransferase A (GT-A) superfamily protein (DUF2064 family)